MTNPRHATGRRAEDAVAGWLGRLGWRVLATRWRCRYGEIDLVCLDPDGVLVGIEVRARRTGRAGLPEASLDPARLGRLRRALAAYAMQAGPPHIGSRLDLVALSPAPRDPERRWQARRIRGIGDW